MIISVQYFIAEELKCFSPNQETLQEKKNKKNTLCLSFGLAEKFSIYLGFYT